MKSRTIIMKLCIICQNEIFRAANSRSIQLRRGKNAITCSRKCSVVYTRVYQYIKYTLMANKERCLT